MTIETTLEQKAIAMLARYEPEVELIACETVGAGRLRIYIDHPDGVTLALCEKVTRDLRDLLTTHALEVSSPGPERPLTKPDHFARFVGRRAQIRTHAEHDGRRNFTGAIIATDDATVSLAPDDGVVSIEYADIARAHLVAEQVRPRDGRRPGRSVKAAAGDSNNARTTARTTE